MEDAKIIAVFWEWNEQAVKETDTAYGGKLYGLANRILNNREDAEESVSDKNFRFFARQDDGESSFLRLVWLYNRRYTAISAQPPMVYGTVPAPPVLGSSQPAIRFKIV